jgi:hypothetical protein
MSLLYYSRMRIIQNFIPLLTAALSTAHVISIFAGSMEDGSKSSEMLLGVPPPASYGVTTVRQYTAFMKTFFFEELAEKHAGKISFTHIYPGLVDGPVFYSDVNPLWFRVLWRVLKPLVSWYITASNVCGEVMIYLATERYPPKGIVVPDSQIRIPGGVASSTQLELGGGAYGVGQRGDGNKFISYEKARRSNTAKEVWGHTIEILTEIEKKHTELVIEALE